MDTNENNTLKVTEVKVSLFKGYMNTKPIKGIASFVLNDQLCLRGIIAMDDENKTFVDYLWDNTAAFFPMTRELQEEIDTAVLDEYIRTLYESKSLKGTQSCRALNGREILNPKPKGKLKWKTKRKMLNT